MVHSSTLYLIRPQVELAEQIAKLSGIPDAKVFFTNSGTEANETALLLATAVPPPQPGARAAQQLPRPVVRHDRHHRQPRLVGVQPLSPLQTSATCTAAYRYRSPFRRPVRRRRTSRPASTTCATCSPRTTAGDVACMIAEPIQGVGGFTIAARRAVRRVQGGARRVRHPARSPTRCRPAGAAPASTSGATRRTACDARHRSPSPRASATACRSAAWSPAPSSWTASAPTRISTFGGNPLATAGGLANLHYLLDHDLQANAAASGARLLDGLRAASPRRSRVVGDVRGKGLMIGVELVATRHRPQPDPDRRQRGAWRRARADGPAHRQGRPLRQRACASPRR